MEEKKGTRDISDLKARLGLKKAGAAPAAGTPSPPVAGLPVPPGQEQAAAAAAPAEPAAPPPDPRRDPFAATQQPPPGAYYGYGMPLPGIDDGTPAKPLSQPKPWGMIGVIAGLALVVVGAGFVAGRSCAARENYNLTINHASDILREVDGMSKTLDKIQTTLNSSPEALKGQPDPALAERLGALGLKAPDNKKIFHTNYFFMEDLAIDRLFTYYNHTVLLYTLIADHVKKTGADQEQLEAFVKAGGGKTDKIYGVVFNLSGPIPLAQFVEMGSPVCAKEGQTDCNANELKGFKYRVDTGATWSEKQLSKAKLAESVIPLDKTPMFNAVASGSPGLMASDAHRRRIGDILRIIGALQQEQKEVMQSLKAAAEKPKVFTF